MKDVLVKGLLFEAQASFIAVSAREIVQQAHVIHDTTATCAAALGRSLMGALMLGASEKGERDEVSLIIKGGGQAGSIVCVGRSDASVKGYIVNPHVELPTKPNGKLDVGGAVGHDGTITVVRDLGQKEPYIGRTQLVSGEIAEDVGAYLAYSQQQPSLVYLGVHISREFFIAAATGIIVQPLPNCQPDILETLEARASRLAQLTQNVKDGQTLEQALAGIFDDAAMTITKHIQPRYECGCNRERLQRVLITLGEGELRDMLEKDGGAELTCQFCCKKYQFKEWELAHLIGLASAQ